MSGQTDILHSDDDVSGGIGIRNALNHDRFIGKADLKCMEETQFCRVDTQSG